jgi:copper chaperone CopZ
MKTINKTSAIFFTLLFLATVVAPKNTLAQDSSEKVYIKIGVDGLSCPFCAYGLEKKLKQLDGSEDVFIELEEGQATMSVPKSKEPTTEELEAIVKDAGFTPREISFSAQPFSTKKDE